MSARLEPYPISAAIAWYALPSAQLPPLPLVKRPPIKRKRK